VIPSVSAKEGGPSFALPLFAAALANCNVQVTVASTDDDGRGRRLKVPLGKVVSTSGEQDAIYFRKNTEFYKTSWALARWLRRRVAEFDVVHIHALFSFSSWAAARAARLARVPYLVRPLGVLNEWGMENRRRFLKQWSLRSVELPILRGAAAIHYTSTAEAREAALAHHEIASFPSAIIPIPIARPRSGDTALFYERFPEAKDRPLILFLSRLDRKKGVELLLDAFQEIRLEFPDAWLVIAGTGEESYVESLRQRAGQLGCEKDVAWIGFVEGEEKRAVLEAATVFVLPSYSENFGVAAAEALAAGVPVLLSDKVALAEDVREAQAGMVVECKASAVAQGLRQLLEDGSLRVRLGEKGRDFANEHYSSESVGRKLKNLYESIVKEPGSL
jgi:glycosyltransferase involved in cell wall biosynthesis